jgi:hypothetical protein
VKPWVASVIRAVLILIAGLVGLVGLFMSACGGILLLGGVKGGAILIAGFLCVGACVALIAWVRAAGHRRLTITLIVLLVLLFLGPMLWLTRMNRLH